MSSATSNWWAVGPMYGGGTTVSTSTTSTAAAALGSGGGRYCFVSLSSNAFVRFGTSSGMSAAAATTGNYDFVIPAGAYVIITLPPSITHYRVIADASGSVYWGKVGN